MMRIDYTRRAAKFIASLDGATKNKILSGVMGLTDIPPKGDIKLLHGDYPSKSFRLRIGKYRVIYRYDVDENNQRILVVEEINLRGNIYD